MIANKKVIESFLTDYNNCKSGTMKCDGNRLFSYSTCIAEFTPEGDLLVNMTPYSNTTSKQLNLLINAIGNMPYIEVHDVPVHTQNLLNFTKSNE